MSGETTHLAAVLGALGHKCIGVDELVTLLPITSRKVRKATAKLISVEFLEHLETGHIRLTAKGRDALENGLSLSRSPQPVFANNLQQRAWTAMLLNRRFTLGDIVTLAARDADKKPERSLLRYFQRLERAGYLSSESQHRAHLRRWHVVRNSGPHAPKFVDNIQSFRDGNSGELFPLVKEATQCV